jgi:hypothetical protein
MKVGDLVQHVPENLGFSRSNLSDGVYLVAGFMPTLDLVSIMDVHGKLWSACRAHLEVINESR